MLWKYNFYTVGGVYECSVVLKLLENLSLGTLEALR